MADLLRRISKSIQGSGFFRALEWIIASPAPRDAGTPGTLWTPGTPVMSRRQGRQGRQGRRAGTLGTLGTLARHAGHCQGLGEG